MRLFVSNFMLEMCIANVYFYSGAFGLLIAGLEIACGMFLQAKLAFDGYEVTWLNRYMIVLSSLAMIWTFLDAISLLCFWVPAFEQSRE
jgi:hypothetical protein